MENSLLNIQLKEGNPAAYKELFKQTFPRLLGYSRLFIQDQAQAHDLVQECFVKLWEKRTTIKPNQSVESLLFVMIRNRSLNFLRDYLVQSIENSLGSVSENELQHLFQLDFIGKEEKLLEEKLLEAIHESIERLPEKRKQVFLKTKIEGIKNKVVADELGLQCQFCKNFLPDRYDLKNDELILRAEGNSFSDSPPMLVNSANDKYEVQVEYTIDATGFNHNVFGGFMSLRAGLYVFGDGKVKFDNFIYRKL